MLRFKNLLVVAFEEWYMDRAPEMASAIAFFGFLAFTPMIGFVVFAGSHLMGEETFNEAFMPIVTDFINPRFIEVVSTLLEGDLHMEQEDLYTLSLLGSLALVLGVSEYYGLIKSTIETIWNLRREEFSLFAFFQRKYKTLLIACISLLIISAGFMLTYLFQTLVSMLHPGTAGDFFIFLGSKFFSLLTFFSLALFLLVYIPPMRFPWKMAIPGALLAAVLHLTGRLILRNYLLNSEEDGNPVESILLLLFWFFYSGQVFIFSAEFSKVYIAGKLGLDLKNLVPEE